MRGHAREHQPVQSHVQVSKLDTFKTNFINVKVRISPPLQYMFACLLFTDTLSYSAPCSTRARQSSQHTLSGKMPEFLSVWWSGRSICLTADRLLCLSAYLTGCPLSTCHVCFGILYLLALQPCSSVCFSSYFYVCLPTSPPLCPPVCLARCLATHRDWHLTMQQERVTEVCNSLLWRSLKHDWQDKRLTHLGE